jgi:hypothetical protein
MNATVESLVRDGRIIEAGWVDLETTMPPSSHAWRNDMRTAYFAGAQHLFETIVNAARMPGDNEVKLAAIDLELKQFIIEHRLRYEPAAGSA